MEANPIVSFIPFLLILAIIVIVLKKFKQGKRYLMFGICIIVGGVIGVAFGYGFYGPWAHNHLWFIGGAIVGFIVALIINLNLKGSSQGAGQNTLINSKKCPFCANDIKQEAVFCQFCKKDLPNEEST